jgi:hypothetical protein
VNIDARRAVIGNLQSEAWVASAMKCQGPNGPQGNDSHTHSSGAWNLACKSSLARPEDCQEGNGSTEIMSQRVMGPLHADCVTKYIGTTISGTKRARLLASQGSRLFKSCCATGSPGPSTHQTLLSASRGAADFEHGLESQTNRSRVYVENILGPKKQCLRKVHSRFFRDPKLCDTSACTGSAGLSTD